MIFEEYDESKVTPVSFILVSAHEITGRGMVLFELDDAATEGFLGKNISQEDLDELERVFGPDAEDSVPVLPPTEEDLERMAEEESDRYWANDGSANTAKWT